MRAKTPAREVEMICFGESVDHLKSHVVPGPFVLDPGISESCYDLHIQ